ncbi:hypothetical protein [Mycolicibacterium sp. CR10]|uniref:hypothetical protein n=1 Tax=Mycolicibacterium sp. CR10 TaxID=2562314 RepID=UPI0010C130B3|nr:hypothetical protein [Mycolicibacterium sp. CR10]
MDPITLIVAALALGASDGVRDTAKQAIGDAYSAVKNLVSQRYSSVSADLEGLEQEPEEGLRRALLEKKLNQAGAGDDVELYGLAQALLSTVEEQAPDLPATIGVVVRRAAVGGNIEVEDVAVDGGTGVAAEDVAAGGDLRISRVVARAPQAPPHPPRAREQ